MDVWEIINNVAFPIFVAAYVLIRLEPAVRDLTRAITVLTAVVAKQGNVELSELREIASGDGT